MENKNSVEFIETTAAKMRRNIIEMGYSAGSRGAHFGPALSSVEIVASLFFDVMNHDPKNPHMPERDRFVLSKGHACLSYYSALVEAGYITEEQMYTFKQDESFCLVILVKTWIMESKFRQVALEMDSLLLVVWQKRLKIKKKSTMFM